MAIYLVLLLGAIVCAIMAVRSKPLVAALWLAGLSAFTAIIIYLLGAPEVAVIELSVGAGLITVLLAFVISMAEDESMPASLIPRSLAWFLVILAGGLLVWLILPEIPNLPEQVAAGAPFFVEVWHNRLLDLIVQITIILGGVLGVLSLLGETSPEESVEKSSIEGDR